MSIYNKYFGVFERGFIGYSTLGVLAQSCMGGIAAMAILQNGTSIGNMFQLFLIVISCMAFNGSVLAQQKPKVVFNILIWSVLLSIVVAAVNFL
jgi:hypothetical protein